MSIPSSTLSKPNRHPGDGKKPITIFGPDFPFAFDDWIEHPAGLGSIPAANHGAEVAMGTRRLVHTSHVGVAWPIVVAHSPN